MSVTRNIAALVCAIWPGLSSAHELWVEAERWQVAPGESIEGNIRNGERFEGSSLVWLDRNVARAEAVFGPSRRTLTGRAGDRPALVTQAPGPGLGVLIYETTPSTITYRTWEKFQNFIDHKALPITKSAHLAAGHPETGFTESYTRHTKALIDAGGGPGADQAFGLETEIIALSNPYADSFNLNLPIQVLYQDRPRAFVQVEIIERAPDGQVDVRLMQTDAAGRADIPVRRAHTYLLDAVVLRDSTRNGAIYDTLWAALTFYVPN